MSVSIAETKPLERDAKGNLLYYIYGQDGVLVPMKCADTRSNQVFVIMLRQADRYNGVG